MVGLDSGWDWVYTNLGWYQGGDKPNLTHLSCILDKISVVWGDNCMDNAARLLWVILCLVWESINNRKNMLIFSYLVYQEKKN